MPKGDGKGVGKAFSSLQPCLWSDTALIVLKGIWGGLKS